MQNIDVYSIYVYTYMHIQKTNKKEVMNFKKSKERDIWENLEGGQRRKK